MSEPMIKTMTVLSPVACENVAAKVHRLREHWLKRDLFELYTLGAASYLDAPDPRTLQVFNLPDVDRSQYSQRADELNALLKSHFSPLYATLASSLSEALGHEAVYCRDLALPGFHIFGPTPAYADSKAHLPHVDRQYRALDWSHAGDANFESAISFTLPVELPASGGGLRVWNINLYDVADWNTADAKVKIKQAPLSTHAYSVGQVFVHACHLLHQIAPWNPQPGEYRITLQGHGLFYGGRWNLYW